MPDPYELSVYEPLVGDAFRLDFTDHPSIELTLVDASPGQWQRPEGGKTAFRLEFSGPPEPLLEQRIYRMQHPRLGTVEIFIVPIAQDDGATTYEAIVN
ncbi:MAG: hypothetical protein ABR613_10155 [Actinomycetota bacterium]